jgi:hypothetical protein
MCAYEIERIVKEGETLGGKPTQTVYRVEQAEFLSRFGRAETPRSREQFFDRMCPFHIDSIVRARENAMKNVLQSMIRLTVAVRHAKAGALLSMCIPHARTGDRGQSSGHP